MPSKNILKIYVENGYYHIYNRGIEKKEIFKNEDDCRIFLHYISLYLSPVDEILKLYPDNVRIRRFISLNLSQEVDLLSFALMPNHFHFLVKQKNKDGIIKFTRRLMTSYAMYFNKKYDRVGTLFQGRYKAVNVDRDEYLLHLSRYIHLNPADINSNLDFNKYSSYSYFIGLKNASWIKPKEILDYFSLKSDDLKSSSYKNFVEDYMTDPKEILGEIAIDYEEN
jgi:putative transposase